MMKKSIYLQIVFSFLLLAACVSEKKVEYEFPEQMLPFVKTEYAKQCDKGQILYKLNCAKCHNQKVKGHKIVPDFKPEQLKGYELRVTNARHEQNLTDSAVTAEELGLIMTFLNYKKKSNVPMKINSR